MKALSIRSPWWWFILHAGKDIENRNWSTDFRGPVQVHASKWYSRTAIVDDIAYASEILDDIGELTPVPGVESFRAESGLLVGTVEIVDCVSRSGSEWFMGTYGFVLRNPVAYDVPIPCKGALGFFEPELWIPPIVMPAAAPIAAARPAEIRSQGLLL